MSAIVVRDFAWGAPIICSIVLPYAQFTIVGDQANVLIALLEMWWWWHNGQAT